MSALTEPKLDEPGIGSPDDHSHFCRKEEIARAAVEGGMVTAICGVKFSPLRDPQNFPKCPVCERLLGELDNRGNS